MDRRRFDFGQEGGGNMELVAGGACLCVQLLLPNLCRSRKLQYGNVQAGAAYRHPKPPLQNLKQPSKQWLPAAGYEGEFLWAGGVCVWSVVWAGVCVCGRGRHATGSRLPAVPSERLQYSLVCRVLYYNCVNSLAFGLLFPPSRTAVEFDVVHTQCQHRMRGPRQHSFIAAGIRLCVPPTSLSTTNSTSRTTHGPAALQECKACQSHRSARLLLTRQICNKNLQ